jgi:hypothetical protein
MDGLVYQDAAFSVHLGAANDERRLRIKNPKRSVEGNPQPEFLQQEFTIKDVLTQEIDHLVTNLSPSHH